MKKSFALITGPLLLIILAGCAAPTNTSQQKRMPDNPIEQHSNSVVFSETEFDFGTIKQSGGKVSHDFVFTYNGDKPIEVTGVPTSCACTSASVDKIHFNPGESGIVTVRFNPNIHEEPKGKFFKTVALLTDPPLATMPEIKIWAEIDLDLGPEAYELKEDHDDEEEHENDQTYHSITPKELSIVLAQQNAVLVDVHIPEQEHLPKTDLFIPYNAIGDNLNKLPGKEAPIVLYCRSGGMSRAAAYILAEHGYTNVYDLVGGKNAYDAWLRDTAIEQ